MHGIHEKHSLVRLILFKNMTRVFFFQFLGQMNRNNNSLKDRKKSKSIVYIILTSEKMNSMEMNIILVLVLNGMKKIIPQGPSITK